MIIEIDPENFFYELIHEKLLFKILLYINKPQMNVNYIL
jgi:hypothetical protein